jgi:HPt (histidine-containing phosphotransfer) domain-containing protein
MISRGGEVALPGDNSQGSAINFTELLRRLDNDHELMRELFVLLREELPALENSLLEAALREDMEVVRTTGHRLKGMMASLSAKRAASAASRLEELGDQGDKAGLKDALAAFQREVVILLADLDARAEKATP